MPREETICQRVTVSDASKEIGIEPDRLRYLMREKKVDLGKVLPPKNTGGRYEYLIFRPKLDKFLGLAE